MCKPNPDDITAEEFLEMKLEDEVDPKDLGVSVEPEDADSELAGLCGVEVMVRRGCVTQLRQNLPDVKED